jgi:hypothetical protein
MPAKAPSPFVDAPRRAALRTAFGVLAGGLPLLARAQDIPERMQERLQESLVKAAFLHKFASFVEWPAGTFSGPAAPLRIGVLGDTQVWRDLRELARDRDRDGRPVIVTALAPGDPLAGHHILYLRAAPARTAELLAQVPEGVLTVTDSDGAHPRGTVLSFFLDEGRVRFGASLDAAARQKLRLSPRLLAVARSVRAPGHGQSVA